MAQGIPAVGRHRESPSGVGAGGCRVGVGQCGSDPLGEALWGYEQQMLAVDDLDPTGAEGG